MSYTNKCNQKTSENDVKISHDEPLDLSCYNRKKKSEKNAPKNSHISSILPISNQKKACIESAGKNKHIQNKMKVLKPCSKSTIKHFRSSLYPCNDFNKNTNTVFKQSIEKNDKTLKKTNFIIEKDKQLQRCSVFSDKNAVQTINNIQNDDLSLPKKTFNSHMLPAQLDINTISSDKPINEIDSFMLSCESNNNDCRALPFFQSLSMHTSPSLFLQSSINPLQHTFTNLLGSLPNAEVNRQLITLQKTVNTTDTLLQRLSLQKPQSSLPHHLNQKPLNKLSAHILTNMVNPNSCCEEKCSSNVISQDGSSEINNQFLHNEDKEETKVFPTMVTAEMQKNMLQQSSFGTPTKTSLAFSCWRLSPKQRKVKEEPDTSSRFKTFSNPTLESSSSNSFFNFQNSGFTHGQACNSRPINFKPCNLLCGVCGRAFATEGALTKHVKSHENPTPESLFKCKICKKGCNTLGALRMHIRTHTLPCTCHICGKAFSRTWLLQGHIRTHTGEKPYQCTKCSRAFADRSNLRAHMQTHETVKRYSCNGCDKTFSRISLLKRHQLHCIHAASEEESRSKEEEQQKEDPKSLFNDKRKSII